jgi:hypothetical protein
MARPLTTTEKLVLALVREQPVEQPADGIDDARLLELLRYHRLWGAAYRALAQLPPGVREQVERNFTQQRLQTLVAASALPAVADLLEEAGVPVVVVKGPAVAAAYDHPELRMFEDIDVLVPPHGFRAGVEALERAGFDVIDRNWELIEQLYAGELAFAARGRGTVDLHWHLLYLQSKRDEYSLPTADLFTRARPIEIKGRRYSTLGVADTIVHLALHACREGGDRLIWLKDIDQVIRRETPEWSEVAAVARSARAGLPVSLLLLRLHRVLGTPLDRSAVRAMAPAGWGRASAALDAVFPAFRSAGFGNPATLLARSTTSSVRGTLVRAGSGMAVRARGLLTQGRLDRRGPADPDDPGSLRFPAGTAAMRERFLERVAAEAGGEAA